MVTGRRYKVKGKREKVIGKKMRGLVIILMCVVLGGCVRPRWAVKRVVPLGDGISLYMFEPANRKAARLQEDVWGPYVIDRSGLMNVNDTI